MANLSDAIKNNNNRLDIFTSKSVGKRLKRELASMYNSYDDIIVQFSKDKTIEGDALNVYIYEIINNKRICYQFIVGINYPFKPPEVYLNNHKYRQLLYSKTNYEIINLKKISGKDCLCCTSLTCSINWSPGYILNNLIYEIKYYK